MHIQLDPVGGIAGDMFAAAVLDAWPELEPPLVSALERAGLDAIATVERLDHADDALTGSRFAVHETMREDGVPHVHEGDGHGQGDRHAPDHEHHLYRDIRALLDASDLDGGVRARALDIFARLAAAESAVHGVPVDNVSFHEVGAYDSIADIVCAAWLIEHLHASWSCGPLPVGRGRVDTSHGRLPVPAPAVRILEALIVARPDSPVVPGARREMRRIQTGSSGTGGGGR